MQRDNPYFNPRTRVGCDKTPYRAYQSSSKFQSTHPGGVRHAHVDYDAVEGTISIHAPGWGATKAGGISKGDVYDFNPRTRVGCDTWETAKFRSMYVFQSTHPGGVRLVPFIFLVF